MQIILRLPAAILLVSAAFAATASASDNPKLDIGDPAPVLRPSKWLKGGPIQRFEKGKVYVVEFWATWCEPCREAIPHLTELAHRYRGKVDFIGIESAEPTELPKVTAFVKDQGAKMDYHIAADAPGDTTARDWMHAAGEVGIPISFIVGKDGRIGWIGHPAELADVLSRAVAGTLDMKAEQAKRAAASDPANAVELAIEDGDYKKVIELVEAERAKHPEAPGFCLLSFYTALAHTSPAQLRKYVQADLAKNPDDFGPCNWLTVALQSPGLPKDAYRLGLETIAKTLKDDDRKLLLLARGAQIAYNAEDLRKAIELQTRAIEAAKSMTTVTEERMEELRKDLERFRSKVGS